MTKEHEGFVYSICTDSDTEELAQLLAGTFARNDPPAVAVGASAGEFETLVRLFTKKAVEEGLTIVARCGRTGKMAGALLTEDAASEMPEGLEGISAKFDPIFDILGGLDAEYKADRSFAPGEGLHLFLLGVSDDFARRGIGQQLVAACLENGRARGYGRAITEATNKTSQHIFRKHGFEDRVRASYADHRFGGEAVFSSIAEQGGPILMDRALAD